MDELLFIVSLISGIISLYFLVYKPMNQNALNVKENSMNTAQNAKNTEQNTKELNSFKEDMKKEIAELRRSQAEKLDQIEKKKHESHEKIWNHNAEQDRILEDHTLRIRVIEREVGIDGKGN